LITMVKLWGNCGDFGCWVGELPTGCKLCKKGLKSVVFLTGLCSESCFYCPVSNERRGRDVTYINDELVNNFDELISEVKACGSRGVGITGGEPLLRFSRLIQVIKVLKENFSTGFHIHLYTSGKQLTESMLKELVNVGLDELRIHPVDEVSIKVLKKVITKFVGSLSLGIEVPAIPGRFEWLKGLVLMANDLGLEFVNMNELEVSESNVDELIMRGYRPSAERFMSAEGSHETALRVIEWVMNEGLSITVHYCPAIFKDRYQYRLRMILRGLNTKRPHEALTTEGTLLYIRTDIRTYISLSKELRKVCIKGNNVYLNVCDVLNDESLLKELVGRAYVVEAYPTKVRRVLNEVPIEDFNANEYVVMRC